MVNSAEAAHGGVIPRRRLRRVVWLGIGLVVATGLGLLVWHSLGQADRVSHRASLKFLQYALLERAEREGKYPLDLREVIHACGQDAYLDADNLFYVAAGKPYDPQGSQVLVYEHRATRYGFERGRYHVYQNAQYFVRGDLNAD